jgi:hypothetical protein
LVRGIAHPEPDEGRAVARLRRAHGKVFVLRQDHRARLRRIRPNCAAPGRSQPHLPQRR